jgi:hypothetical protein
MSNEILNPFFRLFLTTAKQINVWFIVVLNIHANNIVRLFDLILSVIIFMNNNYLLFASSKPTSKIFKVLNKMYFLSKNKETFLDSRTVCMFLCIFMCLLSVSSLKGQICTPGNTGGQVWKDYNADGVKDIGETFGLEDITVKIYDCNNNLVGTTTTDENGQYTFGTLSPTPSSTNKYRVEFSNLLAPYNPTFKGVNGRTDVQIITTAACDINWGVVNPIDYCQTDPQMAIACYALGDPADLPEPVPALISDNFANRNGALVGAQPTHDVILATVQQIGSVYGLGFSKKTGRVYVASFMKRLTAFGNGNGSADGSTGAIYSMLPDGSGLQVLIDLPASEIGVNPHPTTTTDFTRDPSWDEVGKIGWGDIEVSDDGLYLWAMNLFNRKLYKIDLNTGLVVNSWPIPGITGGPAFIGCATTQIDRDKDLRPFALREKNGKIYVGVTCTSESSVPVGPGFGDPTALNGFVFEFDVTTNSFNVVPVLDFPMSNPPSGSMNEFFRAWKPDYVGGSFNYNERDPRPWLVDLDFVGDDLIVGIRNRAKDQLPPLDGTFGPDGTTAVNGIGGGGNGRIIRAFKSGSSWTLESSTNFQTASLGNNFYEQDVQHANEGDYIGGILYNPITGEIAAPSTVGADAGGISYIQPSTNTWASTPNNLYSTVYLSYPAIPGPPLPFLFGKANGLGEPLLICNNAPLQIGNYVWLDADEDGTQDPCEIVLAGVKVALYKDVAGALTYLANTTTDANGQYYFTGIGAPNENWTATNGTDSLLPNTDYKVVFGWDGTTAQYTAGNLTIAGLNYLLSDVNSGEGTNPDLNDSDATLTTVVGNSYPTISLTTGDAGSVNHTYDVGFTCSLIADAGADTEVCTGQSVTLTATGGGTYLWSTMGATASINVSPTVITKYYVTVTAANGCSAIDSVTVTPIIVNAGTDITLSCASGSAPTTHSIGITGAWAVFAQPSGANAMVNANGDVTAMTLPGVYTFRLSVAGAVEICHDDMKITVPSNCDKVALGNLVFMDMNNNGKYDEGTDAGIDNIEVQLFHAGDNPATETPVQQTLTTGGGQYIFDLLDAGQYFVFIPSSSFSTGNLLENKVSSLPQGGDTTTDDDGDENGQNPKISGGISSGIINLQFGTEPTGETGTGVYTGTLADNSVNMTVDFGFRTLPTLVNSEPCSCFSVDYFLGEEKELYSVFTVTSGPGENWTVVSQSGILQLDSVFKIPLMAGAVFEEAPMGSGKYSIPSSVEDNTPYTLTATNGIDTLTFQGSCLSRYPDPVVTVIDSMCSNAAPLPLIVTANVAGTWQYYYLNGAGQRVVITQFDPSQFPPGQTVVIKMEFLALDPSQCVTTIAQPVFIKTAGCEKVAIGNLVFMDTDYDGNFDSGTDMGIDGVNVQLFKVGDDPLITLPIATKITAGGGFYVFDQLFEGQYFVFIPSSEFAIGKPLHDKTSSSPEGGDTSNDDGIDENGVNALFVGGIRSGVINLLANTEPTGESGTGTYTGLLDDNNVNMTVDFGFKAPNTSCPIMMCVPVILVKN